MSKEVNSKQEVLVIGAGLIGSSVAMHLAQKGVSNVRVVDFDLEGVLSSSELNAGGVRATWSQEINIEASKLSIEHFAKNAERVGYRDCGYLWLYEAPKFERALKMRELQQKLGWTVNVWDIPELKRNIPFMDKTDDLAGALFSPRDGLLNPNLLKNYFREEATRSGAQFEDGVLILASEKKQGTGYCLKAKKLKRPLSIEHRTRVLSGPPGVTGEYGDEMEDKVFEAEVVINCTGAWASRMAEILGYTSPSQAARAQVCIFDSRTLDLSSYGMIVDSSGVYFHPEATHVLAGFSNPNEPPGVNYHYDGDSFFMETIWPALYNRSTGFEELKQVTGWAGLYEVSPDHSAIIGSVGLPGIYEAHSFSGHGVMHSYAAGLGLAELITDGKYQTLDFSILSGDRFEKGNLVPEGLVI